MKLFGSKKKAQQETLPGKHKHVVFAEFANLPTPYKHPDRNRPKIDEYVARIADLRRSPVRMLQEAAQTLLSHNSIVLKSEIRIELADKLLGQLYPVFVLYVRELDKSHSSLPESRERATELIACIDVLEQLAMSYKHVFKEDFSVKPGKYKKARERLYNCGFRVLELIRIQQRFRAWRYQKLPHSEWQDCNQVFFSLVLHNDVQEKNNLLGNIGSYVRMEQSDSGQTRTSSVEQLYLSIQFNGILDLTSWPLRFFNMSTAYLETYPGDIKIEADNKVALNAGWLITFIGNSTPPLFQRYDKMPTPAIRINYVRLFERLMHDHEELAKMRFLDSTDDSKLSRPLARLNDVDRQPFIELMLLALQKRERKEKRHAVFEHEKIKVYFGLTNIQRLLRATWYANSNRNKDKNKPKKNYSQFEDELAGSSSQLGGEIGGPQTSSWKTENFSSGGMLLTTESTNFTHPIQVGQLVAVVEQHEDEKAIKKQRRGRNIESRHEASLPIVGYVCRLSHQNEKLIEVAIVRLTKYVEHAVIKADSKELYEDVKIILHQDFDNNWKVIVPSDIELVSGFPCRLQRANGDDIRLRLGNLWLMKTEFSVFTASSPDLIMNS